MQYKTTFLKRAFLSLLLPLCALLSACGEKTPEQIAAENKRNSEIAVRRAQVLIFDGKTADAIVMLEEASQKYGTGVELCEALAYAYSQEGKFADAAMCFEKASDLKGGDPSLQISAAKTYEQAGVLDSAIKAYEKYLKLKPGDAVAWKSLASCCVKAEYYEDALKHYLAAIKAIGRDPNTTEAAEIGELFIKNGNAHQAQRWLEAAYAVTLPENAEVKKKLLSNLIAVYLSLKDMGKLERAVNDADAIDKNLVESAYPGLHAKIADFKAKLKEAEEAFKTEQKKKEEAALAERKAKEEAAAKAEAERKAKEEAERKAKEESEKAAMPIDANSESDGKKTEVVSEESTISDAQAKPAEAEKKPTALEMSRDYLSKGEAKLAERSAHIAIADNRTSPEAWHALAKSYEAQNKANDSFLAAREALKLNPDDINATLYYLKNASRVQNNEHFLNSLYRAHEKFPNNVEILVGLARTYNALKDKPNARYFYAKFLREALKEHPLYEEMQQEYDSLSPEEK